MINIANYFNCLNSLGTNTGINSPFLSISDLSFNNNQLIYNEIYSTGNHYLNGLPLASNYPLINLTTGNCSTGFNGNNLYQYGNQLTGDLGVILQLDNICTRNTTGIDYIILTNSNNYSGVLTGNNFLLAINDANKLYFQNGNSYTIIDSPLKTKNFIYFFISKQQYVNFGIYDILNNNYNLNEFQLSNPLLNSNNNLYLGNFINNTTNQFTGFSGNINYSLLFNQSLNTTDISNCSNCLMITGINVIGTGINTFNLPTLSGFSTYVNITTGITGYSTVSGNISGINTNIPIYNLSGITGIISGNIFTNFSTGSTSITLLENPIYSYTYNSGLYSQFLNYNINFYLPLASGDYVEIYTYNFFNPKISNNFDSILDWPQTNYNIQIIDNGLLETSGIDYTLSQENQILGFSPSDNLEYDLTTSGTIVTNYSGWWSRSKVQLSGGVFFPSSSQYIESGSGVIITGINNNSLAQNLDLYLNGQKLISGVQYSMISSGGLANIFVLSGNYLPDFDYTPLYSPTGGLPTGVTSLYPNELVFYPREDGPNYYLFTITGSSVPVITNVTGFSQQVWVNGVRNFHGQNFDYVRNFNCALNSGFNQGLFPFGFFNNESTFFNVI